MKWKWIRVFNKHGEDWIGRILLEDEHRIICDVIDDYIFINYEERVAIPKINFKVMEFKKIKGGGVINAECIEYSTTPCYYFKFNNPLEYLESYYKQELDSSLDSEDVIRCRKQLECVIPIVKKYINDMQ